MTDAEWQTCTDPKPMLAFLRSSGRVSDRKLRLFACACCRYIDPQLRIHEAVRNAVLSVERFVDGLAAPEEMEAATGAASAVFYGPFLRHAETGQMPTPEQHLVDIHVSSFARIAKWASNTSRPDTAFFAAEAANEGPWQHALGEQEWRAAQACLLRDILNPFRHAGIDPTWLSWEDGMVRKLAEGIYEERAFDRLPVLADALEEAGGNDDGVLLHCRQRGDNGRLAVLADAAEGAGFLDEEMLTLLRRQAAHVRGCWVLDLLLGKS